MHGIAFKTANVCNFVTFGFIWYVGECSLNKCMKKLPNNREKARRRRVELDL